MSKQTLTRADQNYVGAGYDATLYATNGRPGVPVNMITRLDLGSPIPLDADSLIKKAATTELPTSGSIVYTAGVTSTPQDTANTATVSIQTNTGATDTVLALDVPRNITALITHTSSIASGSILISGYDEYKAPMSETLAIAATGTSLAKVGKKAFKYIKSVTFTAGADMQLNLIDVGHGDILGLPYKLADIGDLFKISRNNAVDTSATIASAVTSTASTTTGDVRGTVHTGVACDTTSVVVWMGVTDPNSATGLRGVTQA
jgi:hypothetical protein